MPQYRLSKQAFIGGRILAPGTVVEFDGLPGSGLEPMDDEGRARKADWEKARKPVSESDKLAQAIAAGVSGKAKPADDVDRGEDSEPRVVQAAGDQALTTVGHTSMTQKSAGGVDAEHLLEAGPDGKLVEQNPHDGGKTLAMVGKADSPDSGKVAKQSETDKVLAKAITPAKDEPATPAAKKSAKR